MTDPFVVLLAVATAVLSIGRITRLLTVDPFPPVVWSRIKWDALTEGSDWNKLFHCHWCLSFWITVPVVLTGWLSELHTAWWIVNGLFAISYAAAMVVERDEVNQ